MPAPVHDDVPETGRGPADRPTGHGAHLPTAAGRVAGTGYDDAGRRAQPQHRRSPAPATSRRRYTGRSGPVVGQGQRVGRGAGRVPDGENGRVPELVVHQRQVGRLDDRGERAQAQQSDARQHTAHRVAGNR